MAYLLHSLIARQAARRPEATALGYRDQTCSYGWLWQAVNAFARGLQKLDLARAERVAVFLPKLPEAVISCFGTTAAGGVFVPVNPVLKPEQLAYILVDCNVRVLVTQRSRWLALREALVHCHDLRAVVLIDPAGEDLSDPRMHGFAQLCEGGGGPAARGIIDADMAAILYTSGSTGHPKGVVLSHRNMVDGARSVAQYLHNTASDRLLAVLPLSFDYGFSQLSTAFAVGASCYLLDYLLPRDVVRAVERYRITGLAAVPPLWVQLAEVEWPAAAANGLRYFTNSGGALPTATLARLRGLFRHAAPYLMYGLTEAFRSSYLPPAEIDRRPRSIGKAIPGVELLVINDAGEECAPHEPGELVHRGSLVAMGYWGDPGRTAERFRPAPLQPAGIALREIAVWSGDTVTRDEEGFLYFVGRRDDMIKTSGYRVSPVEVEELIYGSGLVAEVAAIGLPHERLGQGVAVVVAPVRAGVLDPQALLAHCRQRLPAYMVPLAVLEEPGGLPRNPNGKIDRKALARRYADLFGSSPA